MRHDIAEGTQRLDQQAHLVAAQSELARRQPAEDATHADDVANAPACIGCMVGLAARCVRNNDGDPTTQVLDYAPT